MSWRRNAFRVGLHSVRSLECRGIGRGGALFPGGIPGAPADGRLQKVFAAFASSQAQGLFALATERFEGPLAPALAYWRGLAARYLTELCHTPQTARATMEPIPPPTPAELASLLLSVPPMPGAEYVTARGHRRRVERSGRLGAAARRRRPRAGCRGFSKSGRRMWHQVGRVCFHLAENRRDPDYPFAFLATYAPGVSASGRVQYQPLSQALHQYAGAKDKQTLVQLLSPVHLASQKSPLVKELVDSGDIYQPLAWTPRQAYRFLKDVPVLEESGVLVRLPDWWKKRPRPRVGVTIGEQRSRSKFDADGDARFPGATGAWATRNSAEAEWRELMAADDGLVLLRGQWVEVDRQKLQRGARPLEAGRRAGRGRGFRSSKGCGCWPACPPIWPTTADGGRTSASGRSSMPANGWATCWPSCAARRTSQHGQPGEALQATLRPYQETGVDWLRFLSGLGLGACLADDMGLGKTIQVLALLSGAEERGGRTGPRCWSLPASLLANWKAEMARFTPTLRAAFVHPSETPKEELDRIAADPAAALRRRRRGGDQLRDALAPTVAAGHALAVGGARRGAGHQEPGRPADEGRQAAAGRRAHRADRHAGGEPLVRSLVAVRFSLSGPARLAGQVQGVRQDSWATARRTATPRCAAWCSRTSCGG